MTKITISFDTTDPAGLQKGDVIYIKSGSSLFTSYKYAAVVKIAKKQGSNKISAVQVVGCEEWIPIEAIYPYRYNLYRIGETVHISKDIKVGGCITSVMLQYAGMTSKIANISGESYTEDSPTICYQLEDDHRAFWWEEKDLLLALDFPSFISNCITAEYCQQCNDVHTKESDIGVDINLCDEDITTIIQQFKQKTNENRLQKHEASVRGAEKRAGVAICCGRSEATVTSRHLSYQAVTG